MEDRLVELLNEFNKIMDSNRYFRDNLNRLKSIFQELEHKFLSVEHLETLKFELNEFEMFTKTFELEDFCNYII
ncbi:gp281 [Sphingomonas phage PAU]|uniref:gp281 n=1 Tax=Sphingomonas phage PAU TaxID=1150991 RepID=UPI0002573498|nr:gp281 [Sphingomonas phage PAU]AFF28279.1 gp281 [Sphingomonas phage PAU]